MATDRDGLICDEVGHKDPTTGLPVAIIASRTGVHGRVKIDRLPATERGADPAGWTRAQFVFLGDVVSLVQDLKRRLRAAEEGWK